MLVCKLHAMVPKGKPLFMQAFDRIGFCRAWDMDVYGMLRFMGADVA
jgi:hypothetical protein